MCVTTKDFVAVSGAIHASNATACEADSRGVSIAVQESNLNLASALAEHFERENPRFDRGRFMQACGYAASERTYAINRIFKDERPAERIADGLSLEDAQAHCKDPSTSTDEYMDTYTEE